MSILKWLGSKKRLLNQITPIIASYSNEDLTYIEPFLGSGSVLIDLLSNNIQFKRYICSDDNRNLIVTFNQIKNHPQELIQELQRLQDEYTNTPDKEDYYYTKRIEYNQNIDSADNLLVASLFIFLNKTNFRGKYGVNKRGFYNIPWGHQIKVNIVNAPKIEYLHQLFNIHDVKFIHNTYDRILSAIEDQCIVYLDPPYYGSKFKEYTKERFDYDLFINTISNTHHRLIISNSIQFKPIIASLCLFKHIDDISTYDSISAKHPDKVRLEILVY